MVETEFARLLRVGAKDGSVLSPVIRNLWDGQPAAVRSRGKTSVAPVHHVGVLGHITADELRLVMSAADVYGGFANRFLWHCARRSRSLPNGGNVPSTVISTADGHDREGPDRGPQGRRRDPPRRRRRALLGGPVPPDGRDEPPGLLGAAISRDQAQVLRLSLTYALADACDTVEDATSRRHGLLWCYCRASAEMLFGDLQGDPKLDRLLAAIRAAGDEGLDATGQYEALGRHVTAAQLAAMRRVLENRGLIRTEQVSTDGAPRTVSYALANKANEAN